MRLNKYLSEISKQQLNDLEKFADKILAKFNIDIEFTRHFLDRLSDARNDPMITIAELQKFYKKVQKNKGTKIKNVGDFQAVLKDLQTDLNLPVVINQKNGEFEVTHKTVLRKKDFKTSNKIINYK